MAYLSAATVFVSRWGFAPWESPTVNDPYGNRLHFRLGRKLRFASVEPSAVALIRTTTDGFESDFIKE